MKSQHNSIIDYLKNNFKIPEEQPKYIQKIRENAAKELTTEGFPISKDEKWRKTKLKDFLNHYYHPSFGKIEDKYLEDTCLIPELKNKNINLINGYFLGEKQIETLSNGIIIGSITSAIHQYPELIKKYFHQLVSKQKNPFNNLNTSLFTGGLFVYIPENVKGFTLQINHKLDAKVDALLNIRNLIIAESGSEIDIIQCDDSNTHRSHLATFVSEIFIGENAQLNWYKYQNINNLSALFSNSYYQVEANGTLYTNFFELNGKLLRNEQFVDITGKNANVDLFGLYLTDNTQQSDNVVLISHSSEGSYSNQKFKGIIDDSGKAFFNGQILVQKNAQQTNAYQKNDNILLTDKARISSQPFLEIYADDVSCSHGSTTGEIDKEALFYIRQRGIALHDAKLLQLYAFSGEIIDAIRIPELIKPTKDLVKKRLNGQLEVCEDCILQCASKT